MSRMTSEDLSDHLRASPAKDRLTVRDLGLPEADYALMARFKALLKTIPSGCVPMTANKGSK